MKKLYKTRESLQLSDENSPIKLLSKYEQGILKVDILSGNDLETIEQFEAPFMSKIESIEKLKSAYLTLYPEYYITEEGKKYASGKYGVELKSDNIDDITKEIFERRHEFISQKFKGKEIGSGIYLEERLHRELLSTMDNDGNIDIDNISIPKRIGIIPKPENLLKKVNVLRLLKKDLKDEYKTLNSSNKIDKAKQAVIDIYLQKVNSMLSNLYDLSYAVFKTAEVVGKENINSYEKEIVENKVVKDAEKQNYNLYPGYKNATKNISSYDKFQKGVEPELYKFNRRQVGIKLNEYKDEISKKYMENELAKKSLVEKKGLDYEKIMAKTIDVETYSGWIRDLLKELNLLTTLPEEEWSELKKNVPTKDGKYRFKIVPKRKSISYNKIGRCLLIGNEPQSITYVINKMLTHEFTHVIQHANKEKVLKLELLQKKGGENYQLFTEGGAMGLENEISEEFFGFENVPHPHFINAMKKRFEGEDYLGCLKAFYNSALDINREKLDAGIIDQTEFKTHNEENLKLAINRTLRIFRPSIVDLSDRSNKLTNSKNSIYVEQLLLAKELRESNMEKYMMVAGANLDNFVRLVESGLIDIEKIKDLEADHLGFVRNLWHEIKKDYTTKGGEVNV